MKKIAIWSPLRYANYGDDLQAIVFAVFLKSSGYDVKLFQLEESLSRTYDLEIAHDIDELCKDVKLCIIAGGALLTPFHLPKRILNRSSAEYERDFKDLCYGIKKYGTKFCAISMGGDGIERSPLLYYSRHRINFFKSPNFLDGTVRLEGDVKQMAKFGKIFRYIPDCLLQSPKFLKINVNDSSDRVLKIGVNFKKGKYLQQSFLDDLFAYADKNKEINFYFTTTHMEKTGINYEYLPDFESENVKTVKYRDPTQLLQFISDMDLFITSKLHLGITGLTVGTPFLSYRGPGKAKSFLRSIGGNWAIVNDDISFRELSDSFFYKSKNELFQSYDINKLDSLIGQSSEQFSFCKKVVEEYA